VKKSPGFDTLAVFLFSAEFFMKYPSLSFRSDIEGLRAIAILLVVAAHAGVTGFEGGFIGVDVFFVLSGYLITALLIGEKQKNGRIDLSAFYARRFRRLAPGLFLTILGTLLLASLMLSLPEQFEQSGAAISAVLWVSNFYYAFTGFDYFGPSAANNLFLHTWSLGVEEQFYLLWPWLIIAAFAGKGSQTESVPFRLTKMLLLIFVLAWISAVWLTSRYPLIAFYMMPFRAWQFALGALVWVWWEPGVRSARAGNPGRMRSWAVDAGGWLGLGLILLAALWYGTATPYPGWRALLPSAGTMLVLAAGSVEKGPVKILSLSFFQKIGKISYSWYLWHWPILLLGASLPFAQTIFFKIVLVMLSLLLASLSFYFVERPIRSNPRFLIRPLGILLMIFAAAAAGYHWHRTISQQLRLPEQQRLKEARTDVSTIYYDKCDVWGAEVVSCIYGDRQAAHTAVLLGDSIGAQWFPAAEPLFTGKGWRLAVMTKSHCPLVEKTVFYRRIGRDYTECDEWRKTAVRYLTELKPDVILAGSGASYNEIDEQSWTEDSRQILAELAAAAGHLYLLRATPVLPVNAVDCLSNDSLIIRSFFPDRCQGRAFNADNEQAYRGLMKAITGIGNASIIDMNDLVCPAALCKAKRNGMILYRDAQHLTASFVSSLRPEFEKKLAIRFDEHGNAIFGGNTPLLPAK